MEYPPCINPRCKSHGSSHPNCMCYPQQMAKGGEMEHFCSKDQEHEPSCQYFAGGGGALPPGAIPIDQFQQEQASPQPAENPPEGAIPIGQFQSHEDKYGTLGQQAITVAEGLGKGLAGPLATAAEKYLGVKGEDIENRAEENPILHYGSEAAGLIAPALATEGVSTFTQAGALNEFGHAAAELVGATGAAKAAVKMGVENALFTLGDEVSKNINGNPDSIQTAALHVGLSGILGAGVGYPLGKVSDLWTSKIAPKAEGFVKDFTDTFKESSKTAPEAFSPTEDQPIKNFFRPGAPLSSEEIPLPPPTPGQKSAQFIIDKIQQTASEALADGVGGALGGLSGIPYGKTIGAFLGHQYLKPFIKTVMPSLIKPLLQSESSAEGLKAAFEGINAISRGDALATKAAQGLFEVGSTGMLNEFISKQDKLDKLKEQVDALHNDPEAMMNLSGPLAHYMPAHATALATTAQNAVNYIASQKPQHIKSGVLDTEIPPSPSQEAAYNRTLQIAEQPLSILSHVSRGTLQPKDVSDLQALYPAAAPSISSKVQQAMIQHLAKEGVIPYTMRRGLSILLNQPIDSTFSPSSIASAQATYMPKLPPQMPQGASKAKKGTAALGKSAKLAETPSEARNATLRD